LQADDIAMTVREELNFLLTNRLPRRWATLFMGWFSRIEHPWMSAASIALWRRFSALDLSDAREGRFRSLHECFTRALKEGARPVDPDPSVLVSPCDAIVGAHGHIEQGMVLQAKGFPYSLLDLLGDESLVRHYEGGRYVTLRIRADMYHRFHAPQDCRVEQVTYISGDTWNVNPIALARVERLFCKNERAVVQCRLVSSGQLLTLVPVAAILVASIRLNCLPTRLHLRYRGPNVIACDAAFRKGEEMGGFEHGSTIIVFAPRGLEICGSVRQGAVIRAGQALLRS